MANNELLIQINIAFYKLDDLKTRHLIVLFPLTLLPLGHNMKPYTLRHLLLSLVLLAFSWQAFAAFDLNAPLPINPLLKMGKLDNGLTYYIQKNNKPEKRIELRLVVKAGSILEDDDQQGLAHFTEHMVFNGSTHFKKHELISYLQSIGIKFGADLNAYTGFDETVYILPVPTDNKERLDKGLLVLEDWAQGATFNDADIDAERNIVLEEARLGKGAGDRINKKLYPAIFNGSRYADRLPIGKEAIIKNFKYDAIKRFYRDWYRPNLMAVMIIGDVDVNEAEKLVHDHFDKLKNPDNERPRNYAQSPIRSNTTSMVITDPEATNNAVMIRYPVQVLEQEKTIGEYRNTLVKNISASILAQRFGDLTQQANPPFLGGGTSPSTLVRGFESYTSSAAIGRAGVQPAINALITENHRAQKYGFNADELERTKKNHLRLFEQYYAERDKSNSDTLAAEYIRNFVTGESIPGIVNEYNYVKELLPTITLEEVNHYAQQNIPGKAQKLVAYIGSNKKGEKTPTKQQLLAWVDDAEKTPVKPNVAKTMPTTLMAQPPKAGSVVDEKINQQLGTTEWTLSNGLKVILKPTDFKNDQILMSASRFGGQSLFGDADLYNARYATTVVDVMGMGQFAPTDLQKILAGKSLRLQTSLSTYSESVSGYAGSSDVEAMLQTLVLRLTAPRTDNDLFHAFINSAQDSTRNTMAHPESVFSNALATTLYGNHPRLNLAAKPDDFTHVDAARASAIFYDRFKSAKGFTFVIVGSFKLADIKPLVETYLASLPVTDIDLKYRDLNIRPVKGVIKKDVHAGTEPKSQVSIMFTGEAPYSKEESMKLNALTEVMNLRITDILREKLTLIYGGGMGGGLDRVPYQSFRVSANLPCGPENVDKVIAALFGEIEKMRNEGPSQEDLDKVKLNWIKGYPQSLRTNERWLSSLQDAVMYNTDPTDIFKFEARVKTLTKEDIKAAAQRYLPLDNYVQVVLYPEAKVETKIENKGEVKPETK